MNTGIQTTGDSGTIKSMLKSDKFQSAMLQVLPKHLTPDRMASIAINCISGNEKLQSCTHSSMARVILELATIGLVPNGQDCYIIPYGKDATLMVSYKGMTKLLYRTKLVRNVYSSIVCKNDTFSFNMGQIEEHRIDYSKPRGEQIAVYATIVLKNRDTLTEVMTKEETDAIRKKADAKKPSPAWRDFYGEQSRKTVLKRGIKHFPLDGESDEQTENISRVHKVIDIDNSDYESYEKDKNDAPRDLKSITAELEEKNDK